MNGIQRISSESGNGLCEDQVDLSFLAFADHTIEIIPLLGGSACDALISEDACHRPFRIGHDLIGVIAALSFIAGLLFFFLG